MISHELVSRSSVQATDPCSSVQWHDAKLDIERWRGNKEKDTLLACNSAALKKTAECLQLPVKHDALLYLPHDSGRGQPRVSLR